MSKEQLLWQTVQNELEGILSLGNYVTWIKPSELIKIEGQTLTIAHSNPIAPAQFNNKFKDLIVKILKENDFNDPELVFVTRKKRVQKYDELIVCVKCGKTTCVCEDEPAPKPITTNGLNPKYRFSNFIIGGCNEFAFSASQAIIKNPGKRYNPLFIYGGVGLGKTHLIQAIGNEIIETHPKMTVLYLTAEEFVKDFLDHIKNRKQGFEDRYRKVDVLIVDDIQFIAGKEKTEEAFFHTFNALHNQDKHIIISSDRQPSNIPTLTDRLVSRFQAGMMVDIVMPDFETRCAIIEKKAEDSSVVLSREIVEFLANYVKTNIRELEGALNYVLANCEMRELEPTLDIIGMLLNDISEKPVKHISSRQIVSKVSEYFGIKSSDILSTSHTNSLPRQICMDLMKNDLKMSYPKIARELNRKDHTTIMYGVKKIEREIKLNNDIKNKVDQIRELLYA